MALAIVPQPKGAQGYVALSAETVKRSIRKPVQGKVFEKEILRFGDLHYKGRTVKIDQKFADTMLANFDAGVCDIVQVPKANEKNEHSEAVDANIGEVVGLTIRDKKIFAQIDARDTDAQGKLGKTFIGASAMMNTDYLDTTSNKHVGPTLLHVAVTNRPYVTGLSPFTEELIAASADTRDQDVMVLTSESDKENKMDLDELIRLAREEHGIDIPALQETATKHEASVALSNRLQTELAETGVLTLSNGSEASADDIIGAVTEQGRKIVELSNALETDRETAARDKATARVDGLIRTGHIEPKAKDASIAVLLSNPEHFEAMLPSKATIALANSSDEAELGTEVGLTNPAGESITALSEVERIVGTAAAAPYVGGKK